MTIARDEVTASVKTEAEPFVESDCTIEHEGRTFESGGAFVSDTHLIAYAGPDHTLTDWHGKRLGLYRVTSTWPIHGYMSDSMSAMLVTLDDGRHYNARGMGRGMVMRGKRVAAELR